MKKIILIICLAVIGNTQAQTSSIVIRPVGYTVAPPSRTVVVSRPARRVRPAVIVRPVAALLRPAARRSVVVIQR